MMNIKAYRPYALLAAGIVLILELFLFNFRSWQTMPLKPYYYDALTLTYDDTCQLKEDGTLRVNKNHGVLILNPLSMPVHTVRLAAAEPRSSTYAYAFGIQDDAFSYGYRETEEFISQTDVPRSQVVSIHSYGNLKQLKILLGGNVKGLSIKGVFLNEPVPFAIHPMRMLILFFLIFFIAAARRMKLGTLDYDPANRTHRLFFAIIPLCCILFTSWTYLTATQSKTFEDHLMGYYKQNATEYKDVYHQQLDAFGKAQIELDIPAARELAELENPYDQSQRESASLNTFPFHSFYQGKLYNSLGGAPLLFYGFYQLLTGVLPPTILVCFFFCLLFSIALPCAVREMAACLGKRINFFLLMGMSVSLVFVSGAFWLLRTATAKEAESLCALAALSFFLFFIFRSINWHGYSAGYAAAGVSASLLLGSNPLFGLCLLIPVPALIQFTLSHDERNQKKRLWTGFLAGLSIAAVPVLWYNAARFGSVLDFGFSWRLVEIDPHYLNLGNLFSAVPAFYHYLLQIPTFNMLFPFVRPSGMGSVSTVDYACLPTIGILAYPLILGALLPSARPQSQTTRRTAWICLLAGLVSIYLGFCLYGAALSFTVYMLPPFALCAFCRICGISQTLDGEARLQSGFHAACAAVFLLTILMSALASMDGYYCKLEQQAPAVFASLKYCFEFWT